MPRKVSAPAAQHPATDREAGQIREIAAGGRDIEITIRGQRVEAWWQHPGYQEQGLIGAAELSAAQQAEEIGLLVPTWAERVPVDGKCDGKNTMFRPRNPHLSPSTVIVYVNQVPKEKGVDYNLYMGSTLFFAEGRQPPLGAEVLASYMYYDPDVYRAATLADAVLMQMYCCLREAEDHAKRWFDGYDPAEGRRVPRGRLAGLRGLDPGEITALMDVAFAAPDVEATLAAAQQGAAGEGDLPNSPLSPTGGDAGPSPSDMGSTPTTQES